MVRRAGFTLVEVLVAITLLSVGVLTLAASGVVAAGVVRTAQREEAAARLAARLLDSLVLVPRPGAGSVTEAVMRADWGESADGLVTVRVRYEDAGSARAHYWAARSLRALQLLPAVPAEAAP